MIGNLDANTAPSYVADPTTGRLVIAGQEMGDTGWRNVSADALNGWVPNGTFPMVIKRLGKMVLMRATYLESTGATSSTLYTAPLGFRPQPNYWNNLGIFLRTDGVVCTANTSGEANVILYHSGQMASSSQWFLSIDWPTNDPWPTSLPGTIFTSPGQ